MEIIVDLCNQHHGSLSELKRMTLNAFSAGADVVKVQLMDSEKYFGTQDRKYRDIAKKDFFKWYSFCSTLGIEAMASIFDEERLEWTQEVGMKRHKIASRLVVDSPDLCQKILADNKPTIISTGKIERLSFPFGFDNGRIKYLFCVSKYPTKLYDPDLNMMPHQFHEKQYAGYSDHTIGIAAVLEAYNRGASIIEKHYSNNINAQSQFEGAHACSFDAASLKTYKDLVKELNILNGRLT
jgi:sialic acid synthase SpsE